MKRQAYGNKSTCPQKSFLSLLRHTLHSRGKGQIFSYLLLFASISLNMSCQAQTFRYFDVHTSGNLAKLTPKNYILLPRRPGNEYNLYHIQNPTELKKELKKRLRTVFPPSDTSLVQLLDSIEYKSLFRKDLKIYYCEYYVALNALPHVQRIEDKLFQFFRATQTINLNDFLRIDSTHFEQSNLSISKLGKIFK